MRSRIDQHMQLLRERLHDSDTQVAVAQQNAETQSDALTFELYVEEHVEQCVERRTQEARARMQHSAAQTDATGAHVETQAGAAFSTQQTVLLQAAPKCACAELQAGAPRSALVDRPQEMARVKLVDKGESPALDSRCEKGAALTLR